MRRAVRNAIIIIVIVIIIGIIAAVVLTSDSGNSSNNNGTVNATKDIEVNNTKIVYNGYGTYNVTCDLTPKTNFTYLEMQVEFYDSSNNLLDKDTLVWNINNPTQDQLIKVSGSAYLSNSQNPAYAKVYIVSEAFDDNNKSIYNETVNVTKNN